MEITAHKSFRCFAIAAILLRVACIQVNAQTLLPTAVNAFDNQLPFNAEYIKSQQIKSITFDIIDKKDYQVAEDKGLLNYYEFNASGLLTRFYITNISKVIQKEYHVDARYSHRKKISNAHSYTKNEYVYDTVSTRYFYDNNGKLLQKRYNDGTYYESNYYTYNTDGYLQNEKRFRETNISADKNEFKLGTQSLISEESFVYKPTGKNQLKKICQNDEGRPYKEIIFNTNDAGAYTSINEQYIATWITQVSTFAYNQKGQLISASYKSNANGEAELTRTYEYDTNDCLLTEKHYKNGLLLKEISYVTDNSKKVSSYIIRDPNNKSMRIVKLIYKY